MFLLHLFLTFYLSIFATQVPNNINNAIYGPNPCNTDGIPGNCPGGYDE